MTSTPPRYYLAGGAISIPAAVLFFCVRTSRMILGLRSKIMKHEGGEHIKFQLTFSCEVCNFIILLYVKESVLIRTGLKLDLPHIYDGLKRA